MSRNIEIVGVNSNEVDRSEMNAVTRIIQTLSEDQSLEERIENQMFGLKLKMNSYLNKASNEKVVTTGDFLNEILSIYKIRKNKFAKYIEIKESNLHAILKGRRKVNNKIAKQLSAIFGIEEETWLFIETKNEIKLFNSNYANPKKKYSIKALVK